MKNKKLIWISLSAVAVLIILASIFKGGKKPLKVETEKIEAKTIVEVVSVTGKIQPEKEVKISPDVSGEITEMYVQEGDTVKQGQLLLTINPEIYITTLNQLQANLDNAKAALSGAEAQEIRAKAALKIGKTMFERQKKLHEERVISDQEWENAKMQYEQQRTEATVSEKNRLASSFNVKSLTARLDEGQKTLGRTRIYAPEDGVVTQLSSEKGERVVGTAQMAGTEIMRISNLQTMEVEVNINENDIVLAVSQSGETADTLAALELAKSKGATILGICNVVGSSISRVTHGGSYTHAGPEIGVASTKAFTAQVTVLTLMALSAAHKKGTIDERRFHTLLTELEAIPEKVQKILESNALIEQIASVYQNATNALYLGRGSSFPVALEGALKLKEISYIHAEGYPAAEMKHGPIALIDEEMPVFVIATQGTSYEKVVSNIQEVKARKGKIIAIVTEGDKQVKEITDHVIEIPDTDENLVPLLATIPLQLLSYHIAVMRGCNVDQPRNLAKSVTVE